MTVLDITAFGRPLVYNGKNIRDEHDVTTARFTTDSWAAFGRTHNPNPDLGFLDSRDFTNTSWEMCQADEWEPVTKKYDGVSLRLMQWPSYQEPLHTFTTPEQRDALGLSIDYYESK